jgi:VWFA-related protein
LLAGAGILLAQDSSEAPRDSGLTEQVDVTLVMIDTVVMDGKGRTVPDLTREDFVVSIGKAEAEVATFDVNCPIGAFDDPINLTKERKTGDFQTIGDGVKRRIVFVFDYYFIDIPERKQTIDAARNMIRLAKTAEEEIMIVALTSSVRIEQRFTNDKRQLDATLQRMEHDVTLWGREFPLGSSSREYFKNMITVMDVLDGYDGAKAVVLFSALTSLGTVNVDNWFNDVAMHAAASRAPIYPSYIPGLQAAGTARVSQDLSRFANQSGGRMPYYTSDLSISYRRAQRDLSCQYTLGVYVDDDEGRRRRAIHVRMKDSKYESRYPEMLKLFTDAEVQRNRSNAAFVDPGPYENPLVRILAWPAHPASANSWDTLIALNFALPIEKESITVNLNASVKRASTSTRIDKYKNQFVVDPPADGSTTAEVTVFGDSKLKSGDYEITVVLSKPGGRNIVSASTALNIPQAPSGILIVRGPLLARVIPGGTLIRADKKERPGDTRLDQVLGEGNSFEPMLVNRISTSEEVMAYWNACIFGKSQLKSAAEIHRTVFDGDGNPIFELDPIPLNLKPRGKNLVCHDQLEKMPANTLTPGEYRLDVAITYANSGDLLGRGSAPLLVVE